MNLRICWRTLHCPWGEVLFKSFHIKQKLSPPWVIYYRQILLSACVKEILLTAVRTGYQSITKNFIKWNLSRKPDRPEITLLLVFANSCHMWIPCFFFFPFLSFIRTNQSYLRVPTLIGGNRVLQHALQQNYTKV